MNPCQSMSIAKRKKLTKEKSNEPDLEDCLMGALQVRHGRLQHDCQLAVIIAVTLVS